jgi:hypothetical protein
VRLAAALLALPAALPKSAPLVPREGGAACAGGMLEGLPSPNHTPPLQTHTRPPQEHPPTHPLYLSFSNKNARPRPAAPAGSQYCAWNASSSLLAVSSDALHAVFVFEAGSGRLALRVEDHLRPCLA